MPNVILTVRDGSIVGAHADMPIVVEVLDYDLQPDGGLPGYMKHGTEPVHSLSAETWEHLNANRQDHEGRQAHVNGTAS